MSAKVNFVNIPQELKNNASFCVWKLEKRKGKGTKVPYDPRTGMTRPHFLTSQLP